MLEEPYLKSLETKELHPAKTISSENKARASEEQKNTMLIDTEEKQPPKGSSLGNQGCRS